MELRELIQQATAKVGSQTALAKTLAMEPNNLTGAKAGRRGLPAAACIKLAAILGIDPMAVIAASELVTEKNPEKKALFAPFVLTLQRPALWLMGMMTATLIGGTATTDAQANDITYMSSTPLNPAPAQGMPNHSIGIMSTC